MTTDSALALMLGLFVTCARVGGPLLLIALAAGLVVGVAQAATQLNESSVSFVVKTAALAATLLLLGPTLAGRCAGDHGHGQAHRDGRALAQGAVDAHPAAVQFGKGADQ